MLIIGIDPGVSGGVGFILEDQKWVVKMPDTEADLRELLRYETMNTYPMAYLERVHSMPGQGVSSSFKFGQSYGFIRGILVGLQIPFDDVTPQKWQKAIGCMTKGDKNVSKTKAQQLFPEIKFTHATADAMLIAEYGRRLKFGEFAK